MSEYTPTVYDLLDAWLTTRGVPKSAEDHAEWMAQFDRVIDARDAEVAARAWDEGEQAGLRRADYEYGHALIQAVQRNPYRVEAVRHREGKNE